MYRELGKYLSDFLQSVGINPIYVATIGGIIFSISYIKYFKTWEEEPYWRKMFAIGTFFGTGVCIIASILSLFGYIDL